MRKTSAILLFAAAAAAGCSSNPEAFASRFVTDGERQFSISYLQLLQDSAIDSAFAQLVPELQDAETRAELERIVPALAEVRLDSLHLVGVNVHESPGDRRHVNLSYEVAVGGTYLLMNVASRRSGEVTQVEGFSAHPSTESLFDLHAFSLVDRTSLHFFWLGMLVLMPVACLTAAVVVARSKEMPRRWLWVLVALLAAPVFVLNWTTGDWAFRPVAFLLGGAGFSNRGATTPWIVSFGLPLGAAVALWKRSKWQRGPSNKE